MSRCVGGVYFVKGADLVKVGYVGATFTGGLKSRMTSLQCGSPVPLTLHRFIPSGRPAHLETVLHRRYADHRHHGEWFSEAILSDVDALPAEMTLTTLLADRRQSDVNRASAVSPIHPQTPVNKGC